MSKMARMATFATASLAAIDDTGGVILLTLTAVGLLYVWLAIPLSVAITGLLLLLAFGHQQMRLAYPGGGASIVVRDNWGESAGRVAGATMWIDALLTIAIGIAVAVDQINSVFPTLFVYKAPILCGLLLLITYANLRGVQVPGALCATPTYVFVTTMLLLIGIGFWQAFTGNLRTVDAAPGSLYQGILSAGLIFSFLLLRTFSTGATVLPGFGANSTRHPDDKGSRCSTRATTSGWDVALLLLLCLGISVLGEWVEANATATETMFAQVVRVVYHDNLLQFLTLVALALILIRVAYTSLVNFPHLATLQAGDGCLPKRFHEQDRRPGFRWGMLILAVTAGLLLLLFRGNVERLLPLYIFNVFFHFTLAQTALVIRWRRIGLLMQTGSLTPTHSIATLGSFLAYDRQWRFKMLLPGLVACLTASVAVGFLLTKFNAGVWLILLLLAIVTWGLRRLQQHYQEITGSLAKAAERIGAKG